MAVIMSGACGCSTGRVRKNNEDNFLFSGTCMSADNQGLLRILTDGEAPAARRFAAVFDGMGGENFGELASFAAADAMRQALPQLAESSRPVPDDLGALSQHLNIKVVAAAKKMMTTHMGTTMVAFCFADDTAFACNVGDSRAYLLRDGKLIRMSEDHVENRGAGKKSPLTQHLGIDPEELLLEPHISSCRIKPLDMYLLCSDGLTDMLTEEQIAGIMAQAASPRECVQRLIEAALSSGGRDNITVIVYTAMPGKGKSRGWLIGVSAEVLCCALIAVLLSGRIAIGGNKRETQPSPTPESVSSPVSQSSEPAAAVPAATQTPRPVRTPEPTEESVPTPEAEPTEEPTPTPEAEPPEEPAPTLGTETAEDYETTVSSAMIEWSLEDGVLTVLGTGSMDESSWSGVRGSITSIHIGAGITGLEDAELYKYGSLREILVDAGSAEYYSEDGVLFNRERQSLVCYPPGREAEHYTIPEDVVVIERNAFRGSLRLTSLTLPASLEQIRESAFRDCPSLRSIICRGGRAFFSRLVIEKGNEILTNSGISLSP